MRKRLILAAALALLFAVLTNSALASADAPETVYDAGDGSAVQGTLLEALEKVADNGTIKLLQNIELTCGVFNISKSKTVTILGEGHTIDLKDGSLSLGGSFVLNLGAYDYENTLVIKSSDDTRCILGVGDNATLNMYDGVTLGPSRSGGQAAGVQLSDEATFNMYGGVIKDCENWASVGGGVVVTDSSTFNMYDGLIENCSGYQGGAICLGPSRPLGGHSDGPMRLNISGGIIRGCTDMWLGGGAISASSDFAASISINGLTISECGAKNTTYGYGGAIFLYMTDSNAKVEISDLTITGCEAAYGGGIFIYKGNVTLGENVRIYNNSASSAGDDLYFNYSAPSFGEPPSGLTLESTGRAIDGWYIDGALENKVDSRWTLGDDDSASYTQKIASTDVKPGTGLKAAHGDVPTYDITVRVNDSAMGEASADLTSAASGTEVTLAATAKSGYSFKEWQVVKGGVEIKDNKFTMPDGPVEIVAVFAENIITVKPADITVYMGGESGYKGVVDDNGALVTGNVSLPTPGFVFNGLPDGVDPTTIVFTGAGGREWTVERYPGLPENARYPLYVVKSAEGQEPVRVQFSGENGAVSSDSFEVGINSNQALTISVYRGSSGNVTANVDGQSFNVEFVTGTLTVRGTTESAAYAVLNDEASYGTHAVEADDSTVFTLNGSEICVDSRIALLFDDIIDTEEVDRSGRLIGLANEKLGNGDWNYELKYLNLVDRNNGNAWVEASKDVTIYWPLPKGTDSNTKFRLLHFEGLHRSDTDTWDIKEIEVSVSENHLVFNAGETGFSPFVLAWETADYPIIPPVEPSEPEYIPDWLNTEDHFGYIIGYEDGTIRPRASITRAEVATIFFRLLTDEARAEFWTETNDYTDVSSADWFNNAVSTLSRMGILGGYEDGSFRPSATITRAEFAKIAVSFFEYEDIEAENIFTDVAEGSWYENFVAAAAEIGLIEGYEGNVFRPDESITRAEACTIINRTLNRAPDKEHLLPESEMNVWPDNTPDEWFYADMQEATNSHEYKWLGDIEQWLEKLPERDWDALQ